MPAKLAKTRAPIHDLIARRWSGRAFDAGKPVSREQILSLLEAARWAPSCYGDEPWRFIVWDKNSDAASWHEAFACLGEFNQQWVKNAPVLVLATAGGAFHHNGKPNRWGQYDTGAAAENLCLQAAAQGLMAHQMGGFDTGKTRKSFNIPLEYECMAMIAVGHPASADVLEGDIKTRELSERLRSPLEERFFEGGWGVPVKA
ncbi:MAG: nitroreductase family protein [Gammaproteobacteria bacterium]|nr:nitroreductase family protein [Gammaproteobacteria bacterium]